MKVGGNVFCEKDGDFCQNRTHFKFFFFRKIYFDVQVM